MIFLSTSVEIFHVCHQGVLFLEQAVSLGLAPLVNADEGEKHPHCLSKVL